MPIDPSAQQLAQLMAAIQQQQAMQLMQQKQLAQPQGLQPPPTGQGQGLAALLGGAGAMGAQPQQPQQQPTLGFQQPMPMQLPQADPQGQQKQAPLPPDPMGLQ